MFLAGVVLYCYMLVLWVNAYILSLAALGASYYYRHIYAALVPLGCLLGLRSPAAKHLFRVLVSKGRVGKAMVVALGEVGAPCTYELVFPHFMFCDPWVTHDIPSTMHIADRLLMDKTFHKVVCPWVTPILNGASSLPLTGGTIRRCLALKRAFGLFPGGFVEAAGITATREVLYAGTLGYHLVQARQARARMSVMLVYDSNPANVNIESFASVRLFLARRGMPLVMPDPVHFLRWVLWPSSSPVFVRRVEVDVERTDSDALAVLLLRTYKEDAAMLLRDHGVALRIPEVHFRDAGRRPLR